MGNGCINCHCLGCPRLQIPRDEPMGGQCYCCDNCDKQEPFVDRRIGEFCAWRRDYEELGIKGH